MVFLGRYVVLLLMHMMHGSCSLDVAPYRVLEIGRSCSVDADKPCVVDGEAGLNLRRVLLLILQCLVLPLLILLLQRVLLLRAQLSRLLQLLVLMCGRGRGRLLLPSLLLLEKVNLQMLLKKMRVLLFLLLLDGELVVQICLALRLFEARTSYGFSGIRRTRTHLRR